MEMETEKRKRSADVGAEGRRTRVKEKEGDLTMDQTATATATATEEEEVEEFFAILRRVHEVMRYFGKGKGGEREGKGAAKKVEIWKPSFQWEDFEEVNVSNMKTRDKKYAEEAVEENQVGPMALDLNVEPVPEPEPVPEKI